MLFQVQEQHSAWVFIGILYNLLCSGERGGSRRIIPARDVGLVDVFRRDRALWFGLVALGIVGRCAIDSGYLPESVGWLP
jgi:hypothetical protein